MVESSWSKLSKSFILFIIIGFMQFFGLVLYLNGYLFWGYLNWVAGGMSVYFLSCRHFGLEFFGFKEKKEAGK